MAKGALRRGTKGRLTLQWRTRGPYRVRIADGHRHRMTDNSVRRSRARSYGLFWRESSTARRDQYYVS
jgi:hypothetical protein